MTLYRDIDGDSDVYAYEFGEDYIAIQFKVTHKVYRYTYRSAGRNNVQTMKSLAQSGDGLNSFINRNVKYLYEK